MPSSPTDLEYLEYDEEPLDQGDADARNGKNDNEDLFGSDEERDVTSSSRHDTSSASQRSRSNPLLPAYNSAAPIASSSAAGSSLAPLSTSTWGTQAIPSSPGVASGSGPRYRASGNGDGISSNQAGLNKGNNANGKGKERAVETIAGSGSSTAIGAVDVRQRMNEMRIKKRGRGEKRSERGVRSLKGACMAVIKANSTRIWDVGDMEYTLIAEFLDELPMEQLAEIEVASPQLKKDTDWLWEYFILQDHPLFHERCNQRQGGEQRTTGWRRMYQKAREDAEARKLHAADRLAQRYKQLEDEKSAKRIVFIDKMTVPAKGRAARGRSGGMIVASGGRVPAPPGAAKVQGVFAKARQEAQRARIAITHASGKYVPSTASSTSIRSGGNGPADLYKNPYLSSSTPTHTPTLAAVLGPRLPPPRSRGAAPPPASTRPQRESRSMPTNTRSSTTSPIPGSYPPSEARRLRTALPPHLAPAQSPGAAPPPFKRFKLEDKPKELQAIKKPEVQNFAIPPLPKAPMIDFFNPTPHASTIPRAGEVPGSKRKLEDRPRSDGVPLPSGASNINRSPAVAFSRSPGKVISAEESTRMTDVLFRKKPRAKAKG